MKLRWGIIKYAAAWIWSAFVLVPFMWALTTSFKDANGVTGGPTYIPWLQYKPTLKGWESLFNAGSGINIIQPYFNSIVVTLGSTAVSVVLGTFAAYGISRFEYRFGHMRNSDITFFFVSQRIMPPIVLAIPFFLMLKFLGLLDTRLGLIIVYVALLLPIVVWIMVDFFDGIPREIDEMGMLDGYSPLSVFFRVILPNSLRGVIVASMFCVIFGWNDFFFAFTLTFTQTQLLPVAIVALSSSVTPWWSLSAAALISVAPLVVLAFFVERMLSRGSLSGAIR